MVHDWTTNFRNLAAQGFFGGIALPSVIPAFLRLDTDLALTTFTHYDLHRFDCESSAAGRNLPAPQRGCFAR
jgi:hypothetical protein